MPIQFSSAAYLPDATGTRHEICVDTHVKWLHTNPTFRIDDLVSHIAQQHFGLGEDDDYRISVKRNIIILTILDENGNETNQIHTLDKDGSGKWQVQCADAAAPTAIADPEQEQIALDATTIIERVKAVWAICRDGHNAPKDGVSGATGQPVGGCNGHSSQPIIIHHCCHGNGHGPSGLAPNFQETLDHILRLRARIAELEDGLEKLLRRTPPRSVSASSVDDGSAGLRQELENAKAQLLELQNTLHDMAGVRDHAHASDERVHQLENQLRELEALRRRATEQDELIAQLRSAAEIRDKHEADDCSRCAELETALRNAGINPRGNWATILRDLTERRALAETALRNARDAFKHQYPSANAFVENSIFGQPPVSSSSAV